MFQKKLFRTFFFFSLALSVLVATFISVLGYRSQRAEFISHYEQFSQVVADQITQLERITEKQMNSALEAIRQSQVNGSTDVKKIRELRNTLGVSSIEFINDAGTFLVSTDYDATKIPNLFDMCTSYHRLFKSHDAIERTPLMPSFVDNRVHKFMLAPLLNGKQVVSVGVRVGFLGAVVDTMLQNDPSIRTVTIKTPSKFTLAVFENPNKEKAGYLERFLDRKNAFFMTFFNAAYSPSVGYCCECEKKGLGQGPDGKFYYQIELGVAKTPLVRALARILLALALAIVALIPLSWGISKILSDLLSRRLNDLSRWTESLMQGTSDAEPLETIPGNDEVASINRRFRDLLWQIKDKNQALIALEKQAALAELATQVVHDIRSPIAALKQLELQTTSLPAGTHEILSATVRRIQDIANNLLARSPDEKQKHDLIGLIEPIVAERQLALDRESRVNLALRTWHGHNPLVEVSDVKFKRVLSNLLTNAVEAVGLCGKIDIEINSYAEVAEVSIQDDGPGISASVMKQIGRKGATFGKPAGNGLGVYDAIQTIESWGGSIEYVSPIPESGRGTRVVMKLPQLATAR